MRQGIREYLGYLGYLGRYDSPAARLCEAGVLQCDQALTQDVLHRLPEAQVNPQRQRRNQLGDPNAARVRPAIFA
jgi:hypothetical protein